VGLTDLVAAGRLAALELMTDACIITRGVGAQTYDDATDTYVTLPGEVLYAGRCRVKPRDNTGRDVEAGEQSVALFRYVVSVPISAIEFDVNDVVKVTASVLDPALDGLELRVTQPTLGSQITARRLGCEVQDD
jgi:hypothetical protein